MGVDEQWAVCAPILDEAIMTTPEPMAESVQQVGENWKAFCHEEERAWARTRPKITAASFPWDVVKGFRAVADQDREWAAHITAAGNQWVAERGLTIDWDRPGGPVMVGSPEAFEAAAQIP